LAARAIDPSSKLINAISRATQDPVDYVAVAAVRTIGDLEIHDALVLLINLASTAEDAMVREEAVAALASLGDPRGLDAIIAACDDKPAIRRRCVAALGAFEGDLVEATLDRLSSDRDWQVRQAVAMLRRGELS
jgi:HEAT repeat protein